MRRRRKGNKTLAKTMLISLGIVILMLPILGYLGAFKAVKQQYMEVTMIKLPPPPPVEKQAQAKKAHKAPPHHGGQTHVAGSTKPVSVHVAAAAPTSNSSDDNSIVNSNNTNIGAPPASTTAPAAPTEPSTAPPAVAAPPPAVVTPAPTPPAPAAPVAPDQTASVVANSQVKPEIPDELRDSDLDTQFHALFTVHPDGTADVKMVSSTGNNQLDQLALDAARQWRFRPAVHDGKPVQSYLRLVVEFQVS